MKRKNLLMIVTVFALIGLSTNAQQLTFQKAIGGGLDDLMQSVQRTTDGGYIFSGETWSFGAGNADFYLIKTNGNGDTLWTKTFGGMGDDECNSVLQTFDGGYILSGYTNSFGAGGYDVYLVKTNSLGDTLWTKTYGGSGDEQGASIIQTPDSGYVITGWTGSFGAGGKDVYLIKTNSHGDTLWTKTYGGSNDEYGNTTTPTNNGGYIITGTTASFGAGGQDLYLIKINAAGDTLWTKAYGGPNDDQGTLALQTPDHGYMVLGSTNSGGNWGLGGEDIYLLRTDSSGNLVWSKTLGGTSHEYGNDLIKTNDGGYMICTSTQSFGFGSDDAYLIKLDTNGVPLWSMTYGGNTYEYGDCVQQAADGGYIIAGATASFGQGGWDVYIIKTDSLGNSGCNFMSAATMTSLPPTQVSNTSTMTSHGSIVTSTPASIGNGGIITNLCTTVGINKIETTDAITIFPNPFTTSTTLTLQGTYHNPSLFIYNLIGQEVRSIPIVTNQQITIPRNNLASGMYFYKVIDENKEVIGIGKMVISD